MNKIEDKIELLKKYFEERPDILMAFIFGSFAKGRQISDSDFDTAIYFDPKNKEVELGSEVYKDEGRIWLDIEKIMGINTDLVVLNRAPATLSFEILRTGKPLIIKNYNFYLSFLSRVSFEAVDFMEMAEDYWKIKERSASLSKIDRQRLMRLNDFLESELSDKDYFADLDWKSYQNNIHKRREVERWVENIVNCSIDMAKIILASEKKILPETYKDMLQNLALLPGFDESVASKLAQFAVLRNILAHEYLDIRLPQIQKFIKEASSLYKELCRFVRNLLQQ
ncbi:MAG: DUF86 domain-containing protein [Candidatus Omnitrophica bacterium]|nr:DUF86 domain-containing protein [Candidatus Omnitrophota bacterium]